MEKEFFSVEESLFQITERHPELIDFLANKGLQQLKNKDKRQEFGKRINLKQAAQLKGLNLDRLQELMVEIILETDGEKGFIDEKERKELKIEGLLPCPVRIPLMEELEKVINKMDNTVKADLKAASRGLDWLKERITSTMDENDFAKPDTSGLADIFISAGFDLFFDKRLMEGFRQQGVFTDSTGINKLNNVFVEDNVDLLDPQGDYSVLAVVPAVFLINREELGDRKAPQTWADLLSKDFADSVSLPVSDFDLFNAILINIYKNYGHTGIKNLGRSMMKSQHPSQMVKEGGRKKRGEAAVTIMPYFFTRMARRFGHMEFIWPQDGAVISPIFMLIKKESLPDVQPLVDFFASLKTGKILAKQGLFPSVLPEIDNKLGPETKFMWPGWDYLRSEDPGRLIEELTEEFNQNAKGVLS